MHKKTLFTENKRVMKNRYFKIVSFVFIFLFCLSIIVPIGQIMQLQDGFLASFEDVEYANNSRKFGSFIQAHIDEGEKVVGGQVSRQDEIVFKLFGFLPIKRVGIVLSGKDEFYVGGVPIGLSLATDGAVVVSNDGTSVLKEGDILTEINGQEIESLDDIEGLIENRPEEAEVEYLRKNKKVKALVKTLHDKESGKQRLGLWVKDDVTGIGTLTFVNKNTHRYGALGHPIVESNSGNVVPVCGGNVYSCNLIGITKGKKNSPGELRCLFLQTAKPKGTIENNGKFGINGVLSDTSGLVDENLTAKLGGRLGVKLGTEKIVSTISGIREEYDIEIIKANYQKSANDKSLVFRVKDKRLLDMTGGIVQGMSGSPIIQDGKIIGAVTHVFLNDPTKGYGVYSDWMM